MKFVTSFFFFGLKLCFEALISACVCKHYFVYFLYSSHGVFNVPVTCEAGHSFCRECIQNWQRAHNTCPVDRGIISRPLVRNLAVDGVIRKKIIKCLSTASGPGCSWTGAVAELEGHMRDCPMKVVVCPFQSRGCILRTYKGELDGHLTICPFRTERCHSCGLDIPINDLRVHAEECVEGKVPCTNGCGVDVER